MQLEYPNSYFYFVWRLVPPVPVGHCDSLYLGSGKRQHCCSSQRDPDNLLPLQGVHYHFGHFVFCHFPASKAPRIKMWLELFQGDGAQTMATCIQLKREFITCDEVLVLTIKWKCKSSLSQNKRWKNTFGFLVFLVGISLVNWVR